MSTLEWTQQGLSDLHSLACSTSGKISSDLYRDWLRDENFKFWLVLTHFNRFSPFSCHTWWNDIWSSLENSSHNSVLVFGFLKSQHDNVKILDKVIETFFLSWLFALIHVYPRVIQYYEQKILLAGRMDKGPNTSWSAIALAPNNCLWSIETVPYPISPVNALCSNPHWMAEF